MGQAVILSSEKLHCLAGLNPFHNGHLALFQGGLNHASAIDVSIGRKAKPHRLSWELRREAAAAALEAAGISDRVSLITVGRKDIDPSRYAGALMGSNLLLELFDKGPKFLKPDEKEWFFAFPTLVVCERTGVDLSSEILERASGIWRQIDVFQTPQGEISGTLCCRRSKEGQSIEELVPSAVWKVIQPHLAVLRQIPG